MEVHQLIPVFRPGDAMGAAAIAFQSLLRRLGHLGNVYAGEVAPGFESLVTQSDQLRPSPDALVLYHHGIAAPQAGQLLHLGCRTGVIFHNITPAHFYAGTRLEEPLRSGRAQLAALAESVDLSIGVSRFNAEELRVAGHRNVHVVPLFIEAARFDAERIDTVMRQELKGPRPLVLSVSRVVAHKRVEDLLRLHTELRALHPQARLVIVGSYEPGHAAFRALKKQAADLGGVTFLGHVTNGELVAAYRSADVYVSMSEHEGFGVPLVEAMAADIPVLAFGAAAVPETMGGRGITFDEKHFAGLAELITVLMDDVELRTKVIDGQRHRVEELSAEASQRALAAALDSLPALPKPQKRKPSKKKKLGIVVQRYGPHILGGAEAHARQVAHALTRHLDVTVLTSCADDHLTWKNVSPEGESPDGEVRVLRFKSAAERRMRPFNGLSETLFGQKNDLVSEQHWLAEQGPRLPGLLQHLTQRQQDYDAFVFFTYLYAPTAWGVPLVGRKALVVPTAHPEPAFDFESFADVFECPHALLCNTPEEDALIRARFPKAVRSRIVGVGVEAPQTKPSRFAEKYGLRGQYLLYVGRQEAGKGLKELLKHHRALVNSFHDAPTLVFAGTGDFVAKGDRVKVLGKISEQDKFDGLAGALAAVVPSRMESLSLLALESFASGTPILANAESNVLVGHVDRSQAGVTFSDPETFVDAVRTVGAERDKFRGLALEYAKRFSWKNVVSAYLEEIDSVVGANANESARS